MPVTVILLILLLFQLFHNENVKYKDKSCVSGCSPSYWSFCVFLQSSCLCAILLMGQNSGHQERRKNLELAPSETMKAEAEVQNNKDEAEEPKAKDQRLALVFGVADLKNGNNVLSILHSPFFCFCHQTRTSACCSILCSWVSFSPILYLFTEKYTGDSHFALPSNRFGFLGRDYMRISELFPLLSPQIGHCSWKGLDASPVSFQTQPALLLDLVNHGLGPSYSAASLDWPLKSCHQYFRCTYCSIPAIAHPYHRLYAFLSGSEFPFHVLSPFGDDFRRGTCNFWPWLHIPLWSTEYAILLYAVQTAVTWFFHFSQASSFVWNETKNTRGRLKGKLEVCAVDS